MTAPVAAHSHSSPSHDLSLNPQLTSNTHANEHAGDSFVAVNLDDSRRYAIEARKGGAPITLELWQGMHHVFQLDVKTLASARRAFDRAAALLEGAGALPG